MENKQAKLSKKDEKYREFALNGNMWLVLLHVGLPLAFYQELNGIFKILDSMMASHISADAVSAVAYLSQINMAIAAVGGGLATGGSLKISQAYGSGDYELVKKRVNSLFALCGGMGILLLLFIVPFTPQILKIANTPQEMIEIGSTYFRLEIIGLVIMFLNNVYIAVERARGNSKRILYLNMSVIAVKLALTAIFVYVMNKGITMISLATIISQLFLLIAGIINMNVKNNAFSLSYKYMNFQKKVISPMLSISFPVIVEKVAFAMGKVVINSMSSSYGATTVGALGISNNIGGITTNPQNGFQEGTAAVISQNLGANKPERAIDAFKKSLVINVCVGIIGFILTRVFLDQISLIFATSASTVDTQFQQLIIKVYKYESLGGCIPLGVNSAVMGLMLGFGYTKITLLINFCRVFVFRIPLLWGLQHYTSLGSESVGIVMMASNMLVSAFSAILSIFVVRNICKKYNISFFKKKT